MELYASSATNFGRLRINDCTRRIILVAEVARLTGLHVNLNLRMLGNYDDRKSCDFRYDTLLTHRGCRG